MVAMLDRSKFPGFWKKAQVDPIPESKKFTSFKDFRPICQMMDTFQQQFPIQLALEQQVHKVKFVSNIAKLLDDKHISSVRALKLDLSKVFD